MYNGVQRCTPRETQEQQKMEGKRKPELESLSVSQARQHFSETLNRVYRDEVRVVVEKSGIPVGAIVSPRDLRYLQRRDANRDRLLAAIRETQEAFANVDPEELDREIEKAIAEVEDERRRALQVLRESQAAFDDVPLDEIEREVARAVAEANAEIKHERRVGKLAAAASE